jgi:hypothetical protein
MASPRSLTEWVNIMHNTVNKSNNTPEVSYLEMIAEFLPLHLAKRQLQLSELELKAMQRYSSNFDVQHSNTVTSSGVFYKSWMFWMLLVLVIILACLLIYSCTKKLYKPKRRIVLLTT